MTGSVAPACGMMRRRFGQARHRAVEHQVHHGPRGVEQELQHRPRPPERRVLPADRRRRVDEHAGTAPVELAEHRVPDRVAEVGPVDVGEQDEPVDVEVVDAVRDLGDRGVDVRKRERAEQPEAAGVVDDRASAGLVHLAGQVARGRLVGEVDARGRDRQERRGDARAGPSAPRAPRPTRPGSAACRRAGCGRRARAPAGTARAGSGRGRRACRARGHGSPPPSSRVKRSWPTVSRPGVAALADVVGERLLRGRVRRWRNRGA